MMKPATPGENDTELERQVSAIMVQVGERVRAARQQKGISRRVLSEMSGVSPRYLAQLEAGEGNISIGLLKRVSHSLDYKVDWLVCESEPGSTDSLTVARRFAAADRGTQDAVLRALGTPPDAAEKAGRVCFIGLRGAGKSTLGRMVAEHLDVPFLELNTEISREGGIPFREVFALYGQEGYRRLEASSLDRVIEKHDRVILAVAGGIVAEPETYKTLLSRFHTVWLKASPQEHMERVRAQGDDRPMAGNADAMQQLKSILTSRESLYAQADALLDTSGKTLGGSFEALLAIIAERGFLVEN